jgi:hypothetical protein
VHRVPQMTRVGTFRRGTTSARITALSFSPLLPGGAGGGCLLASASDHGTVKLFRLERDASGVLVAPAPSTSSPFSHGSGSGCGRGPGAGAAAGSGSGGGDAHSVSPAARFAHLLPGRLSEMVEERRAAASVRLPGKPGAALCGLSLPEHGGGGGGPASLRQPRLHCVTAEGIVYEYVISEAGGGGLEVSLANQALLVPKD